MPTNPILDALTREGVLIDVSVRYWRAAKKLRPEDLEREFNTAREDFLARYAALRTEATRKW